MRRSALTLFLSLLLGLGVGEFLLHSFSFRHWLGKLTGRGELEVLVWPNGIYDRDLERAWKTELYLRGADENGVQEAIPRAEKKALLERLVGRASLEAAAGRQPIDGAKLDHELELVRWEFRDEKGHSNSLGKSPLTAFAFRQELKRQLRARDWLETKLAEEPSPNESEMRRYFETHRARWAQPARWRASHLFLAAPAGSPAELMEEKRDQLALLAKRVNRGESFRALVAEFSEDEATKKRDGDLGYFAEERMLPEIVAAVRLLQPGQISPPVQSRLGFHLLRLTEALPARELSYEEVRPEIVAELQNQQRPLVVARLIAGLR